MGSGPKNAFIPFIPGLKDIKKDDGGRIKRLSASLF
jgi:hypothetical protein